VFVHNELLTCRLVDHAALWRPLIEAIGERGFEMQLLALLNRTCGAEHCAIFAIEGACPTELAAASLDGTDAAHVGAGVYVHGQFWKRDPTMAAARRLGGASPANLFRLDIAGLQDQELKDIVYPRIGDRLLLSGPTMAGKLALSVLKSGGGNLFGETEKTALTDVAPLLLPILGKHARVLGHRAGLLRALSSLEHIEHLIACVEQRLPRRENQVCARMIFGMSAAGIALDLAISEETVATYRKRIYHRLGISTHRDVLVWYVSNLLKASPSEPCP
jgi:DNA-binding CsgD family transcriptional regulator